MWRMFQKHPSSRIHGSRREKRRAKPRALPIPNLPHNIIPYTQQTSTPYDYILAFLSVGSTSSFSHIPAAAGATNVAPNLRVPSHTFILAQSSAAGGLIRDLRICASIFLSPRARRVPRGPADLCSGTTEEHFSALRNRTHTVFQYGFGKCSALPE